jgi:O-acetyl-ADP-ribose deacetylase (regulator of RNase III)
VDNRQLFVQNRLVCQIVNDKTANWGGAGFASAVRRKWPEVQKDFKRWASEARDRLSLGNIVSLKAEKGIEVFCIVAQKGYGASSLPRIRYSALEKGLQELAERAAKTNASIHMPRIGVGHAGGNWIFIEEL